MVKFYPWINFLFPFESNLLSHTYIIVWGSFLYKIIVARGCPLPSSLGDGEGQSWASSFVTFAPLCMLSAVHPLNLRGQILSVFTVALHCTCVSVYTVCHQSFALLSES